MIKSIKEKNIYIKIENSIMVMFAIVYVLFVVHQTQIFETIQKNKIIELIENTQESTLIEEEFKTFEISLIPINIGIISKKIDFEDKNNKALNWIDEKSIYFSIEIPIPPPQII